MTHEKNYKAQMRDARMYEGGEGAAFIRCAVKWMDRQPEFHHDNLTPIQILNAYSAYLKENE